MITLTFKLPGRQKTFTGENLLKQISCVHGSYVDGRENLFENFLKDFGEAWEDVVEVEQHDSWNDRVVKWSPFDFLCSIGWAHVNIKSAMEDL